MSLIITLGLIGITISATTWLVVVLGARQRRVFHQPEFLPYRPRGTAARWAVTRDDPDAEAEERSEHR